MYNQEHPPNSLPHMHMPLETPVPSQHIMSSSQNKKCKQCKETFPEGAEQRNSCNFIRYGFKSEEDFKKHTRANKRCPAKGSTASAVAAAGGGGSSAGGAAAAGGGSETAEQPAFARSVGGAGLLRVAELVVQPTLVRSPSPSPVPRLVSSGRHELLWPVYKSPEQVRTDDDYMSDQLLSNITLTKYSRGPEKPLWFPNSETASWDIVSQIRSPDIQWISLVAQPGSGKTMVIHKVIQICTSLLIHSEAIHPDNITVTTGMSDKSWHEQTFNNLTLRSGTSKDYLWKSLNDISNNNCLVHRANLNKRVSYLLNNLELMSNHIFIIDESHFADSKDMTIDDQFVRLGLSSSKMNAYNIKVILVSATPDVTLSMMNGHDNHKQVVLHEGAGYKGFKYYSDEGMIEDYNTQLPDIGELESLILSKWTSPRYHYMRVRQSSRNEDRSKIEDLAATIGWVVNKVDCAHGENVIANTAQEYRDLNNPNAIRVYLPPPTHTIILLSDKFRASKRLQLTKYVGLVAEKPAVQQNTTVTCNGLIPRFWGYYPPPDFPDNQRPLFLCNINCVNEYIKFTDIADGAKWVYDGKDYTGQRIVSNSERTKELRETCYGNIASISPTTLHPVIGSRPIQSVPLQHTDVANMNAMIDCASTTAIMRQDCVKSILARTHPEVHAEYESYNWQVWVMSTGDEHYGDMNPGSRDTSTESTVCRDGESQLDIIRVYYTRFEESPRFVIKAWNGSATIQP